MKWKLAMDDARPLSQMAEDYVVFPEGEWCVADSVEAAILLINHRGLPTYMTLDHDMGAGRLTGMDFVTWLIGYVISLPVPPKPVPFFVHSANYARAGEMRARVKEVLGWEC